MENADGWKTVEGVCCPWKGLEGTGEYWTHGSCLDIDGWLSYCMPHVSCLASLMFHFPLWILGFTHHCLLYILLLTLCLLIAYWAWLIVCYYTLAEVLISHSIVAGSSPAWLLVFTTVKYQEPIAEFPFPTSFPVWTPLLHLRGHYSTSSAPLFSFWSALSSTSSTCATSLKCHIGLSQADVQW